MARKIFFTVLWLSFLVYAFYFAPPNAPNTLELIKNLSLGQWSGINPLIIALFNLMGILPMIYTSLLLIDGVGQKIPVYPFIIGSFAFGAFALIPYLILREPNPQWLGKKTWLIKIVDSRILGIILTVTTLVLLFFGLSQGDWQDFIQQWKTSKFINVMSLDFCLLTLLIPSLIKDDMARRNIDNEVLFLAINLVPLFGSLLYLCLRPPLPASTEINQPLVSNN